jgi:Fur family transcriptional regulator, ferric uptake regulator
MTRARAAVLAALDSASEPLSAAGVAQAIEGVCDQATVYRALHYLEEEGLAESFVLQCSEHGVERYYASRRSNHRHWFHCESCHRFIDLGACKVGGVVDRVERELGVRVARHTLYMTGSCPECSRGNPGGEGPRAAGRER